MNGSKLEYGPLKRIILYGGAGICGMSVDCYTFFQIKAIAPAIHLQLLNIATYSLGTCTSFMINRKLSFRSKTHKLAFIRFYLTSVLGMLVSTLMLMLLMWLGLGLVASKAIATLVAVCIQYAVNSKFSIVSR